MPGRAERVRRARRLAVGVACLTVATVLVLLLSRTPGPPPPSPAPAAASSATPGDHGTALPSTEVRVSQCGTTPPAARPAQLRVVCASTRRSVVVSDVTWGSWGQLNALGTALVLTNDCRPTCEAGQDRSSSATVVLDQVETTHAGPQFTRVTILWSPPPEGFDDPLQVRLPRYPG